MPRRFSFQFLSVAIPTGDHVSDGDLLRRFAQERDPAAFELLVRRHADAVWTACRGVLGSETDAEDAFQATFLVLAQKAETVRGKSVGGWLHRVAVNAALKLRERSTRVAIATAEQLNALPAPAPDDSGTDLSALIQEELANLPERYRLPVVLCELEGLTHAEAAKVLGWPIGSVSSRLSRARTRLRDQLARRGVSAPAVVFPAAGLPPALLRDTTAAAVGTIPVLPTVSILTQRVLTMMRLSRYRLITIGLVSVGLVATVGFGTYTALGQPAARPITEPIADPVPVDEKKRPSTPHGGDSSTSFVDPPPASPKIPKELLENRLEAARKVFQQNLTRLKGAQAIPSDLFGWSERWLDAELALATKPTEKAKALRDHLDRTREVERVMISIARVGLGRQADADAATYYRLEAEIHLLKQGVEPYPAKDEKGQPEKK
jgi:RNA polymerase sigma factor (sigma-70 family)